MVKKNGTHTNVALAASSFPFRPFPATRKRPNKTIFSNAESDSPISRSSFHVDFSGGLDLSLGRYRSLSAFESEADQPFVKVGHVAERWTKGGLERPLARVKSVITLCIESNLPPYLTLRFEKRSQTGVAYRGYVPNSGR